MATFNFVIKKESYELTVNNMIQSLNRNDLEQGLDCLQKAINLSNELIANCKIPEIKEKYIEENKNLHIVLTKLVKEKTNPFIEEVPKNNGPKYVEEENNNQTTYFKSKPPHISLDNVAGLEEVKRQIRLNVILPFQDPELYYSYKDTMGCQILMYGPPGCGKSFVAEAIAGELSCAYAIIKCHEILDKYVGEAPKKIAQIFEESKKYDRCLIFFDEVDALFASRDSDDSRHTKEILTTFLTCLSGFDTSQNKDQARIVIGATNRPWAIDSAALRGKRFDTHIYVTLPDEEARRYLITKAFKNHPNLLDNSDITIEKLVNMFENYSCSDIESILSKACTNALERATLNKQRGNLENVPLMLRDVQSALASTRNSVTKESLEAFEAFRKGEI